MPREQPKKRLWPMRMELAARGRVSLRPPLRRKQRQTSLENRPYYAAVRQPLSRLDSKRWLRQDTSLNSPISNVCTNSNSRSEEHTSELQSQSNLVCRLLL